MRRTGKMKPDTIHFGQYLAKLRKSRGVYQRSLARKLGLKGKRSVQSVSNWEQGLSLPTPEKLPRIRTILELSQADYNTLFSLYDEAKRRRDRDRAFSGELRKEIEGELKRIELYKAPLYGAKDTVNPVDFIGKHRDWTGKTVNLPPELQGGHVFAFHVEDDSMAPDCLKGDTLFCDLNLEKEVNGAHVVARVKDEVFCRIYEKKGNLLVFRALNPKYPLVTASEQDEERGKAWFYRVAIQQRDRRGVPMGKVGSRR